MNPMSAVWVTHVVWIALLASRTHKSIPNLFDR